MNQAELTEKIEFVRKRHNFRVLILLIIFIVVFFGLVYISLSILGPDSSKAQRQMIVIAIVAFCGIIATVGSLRVYHSDKRDCYEHSVLCPNCGKHLYHWHRMVWGGPSVVKTGKCAHCKKQMTDESPVDNFNAPQTVRDDD